MDIIEKQYFRCLASTMEECRKEDEKFKEIEYEYCKFLLDIEYQELREIFGDTDDYEV